MFGAAKANLLINFTIKRLAEIFGVIVSSCGIFLLIALLSYSVEDPNFIFPSDTKIKNILGRIYCCCYAYLGSS